MLYPVELGVLGGAGFRRTLPCIGQREVASPTKFENCSKSPTEWKLRLAPEKPLFFADKSPAHPNDKGWLGGVRYRLETMTQIEVSGRPGPNIPLPEALLA